LIAAKFMVDNEYGFVMFTMIIVCKFRNKIVATVVALVTFMIGVPLNVGY